MGPDLAMTRGIWKATSDSVTVGAEGGPGKAGPELRQHPEPQEPPRRPAHPSASSETITAELGEEVMVQT